MHLLAGYVPNISGRSAEYSERNMHFAIGLQTTPFVLKLVIECIKLSVTVTWIVLRTVNGIPSDDHVMYWLQLHFKEFPKCTNGNPLEMNYWIHCLDFQVGFAHNLEIPGKCLGTLGNHLEMNYNFQVGKWLVHYINFRKLACVLQISKQCPTRKLSAFVRWPLLRQLPKSPSRNTALSAILVTCSIACTSCEF